VRSHSPLQIRPTTPRLEPFFYLEKSQILDQIPAAFQENPSRILSQEDILHSNSSTTELPFEMTANLLGSQRALLPHFCIQNTSNLENNNPGIVSPSTTNFVYNSTNTNFIHQDSTFPKTSRINSASHRPKLSKSSIQKKQKYP